MRLFFKFTGTIALLLFLPLLVLELVVGFWYKSDIVRQLKTLADESLESSVYFEDIKISALRNFPEVSISILDLSIKERGYEILKAEKISLYADLLDLYHDNYSLSKVEVITPRFYAPIDSTGKKFMIRTYKNKEEKAGVKLLLDIPEIEIKNALIIVDNAYKGNRIRISVDQGDFRLKSFDDLLEFKGDATGVLDTMISKGKLNQTGVPIAARQTTFRINTLDNKKLFDGILQLYNAQLRAYGLLSPTGNGNLLDITLEGDEARINDYLTLIPQFKALKLVQHNPDAKLSLTIRNSGFVDPVSFPNVDILFELENAAFSRIGLPGKVDSVSFRGHFTNGKERNASTSEMSIDFGHAKIDNSYFSINGFIKNFEEPYINIDASSEIELEDVNGLIDFPDLEMSGSINVLADFDGKISELEKQRRSNQNKFNGQVELNNIQIIKKPSNIKVEKLNGKLTVKNRQILLSSLNALLNDATISASGSIKDFLPFFEKKARKNSIAKMNVQIDGLSISKSDIANMSDNTEDKSKTKAFHFPEFLQLNCDLNMKDFAYDDYNAERIELALAFNKDSLTLRESYFKIEEGELWLRALSKTTSNGKNFYDVSIKADLDHLDTKKYLTSDKNTKTKDSKSSLDFSNFSVKTNIHINSLKHNKVELTNLSIQTELKENQFQAHTFNFDFPFGKTRSSFNFNLKDSVYHLRGNSNLALRAFNIDSLKKYYNTLKPQPADSDSIPKEKPLNYSIDKYTFNITAPSAQYEHFEVNALEANFHIRENRLRLNHSSFELFDGKFEVNGLIRRNEDHDVKAFCNLSASNINLGYITSNIAQSNSEMFSDQHFKGKVGVEGQLLLKYNRELEHQEDQMLGKVNISLSDGEMIKFKPITESLKFIKQANRDTILLANPNLEVIFHNDEIILPTTVFKTSLSNIEFSGYHSTDFDFGFDLQISVSDLLFKSQKKKRKEVNSNQEGGFGLIKHFLQARTIDGKMKIQSLKKKAYQNDLRLLEKRFQHVDSALNEMSAQIVQ